MLCDFIVLLCSSLLFTVLYNKIIIAHSFPTLSLLIEFITTSELIYGLVEYCIYLGSRYSMYNYYILLSQLLYILLYSMYNYYILSQLIYPID